MASTYRVTNLATEKVEVLTKGEVATRFAPNFSDTSNLDNIEAANKWLRAFLDTELFQEAVGVKVTAVFGLEILETNSEEYRKLAKDARDAKATLAGSLLEALKEVTKDEVKKGKHLPKSSGSATLVSTVESYLIKGAGVPKTILDAHRTALPAHVVTALEAIYKRRAADMKA